MDLSGPSGPGTQGRALRALVKHATGVQRPWLAMAVAAPDRPEDPRPEAERQVAYRDEFTFSPHDVLATALRDLEVTCAEVHGAEAVDGATM